MKERLTVAVAVAGLLLGGCGSSSHGAAASTTTAATRAVTTTSSLPPTTAAPTQATVGYPSSYDATRHLLDAWHAGDRTAALQGADSDAVDGMWQTPPGEFDLRGCAQTYDPALTEGGCILRRSDQAGALQVNTEKRSIGWVVSSAVYEPN